MVRWMVGPALSVALLACSNTEQQPSAASSAATSGEAGASESRTEAGRPSQAANVAATGGAGAAGAGAGTSSVPSPAMAGASAAGTTSLPAATGGAGAGASAGAGAGAGASAGQTGAAPAEVISLKVSPDREHLYEDDSKWLCLPGKKDELCTSGLDATILRADGSMEVERHVPAAEPSFDCFYVYPTVSNDSGAVADWKAGTEETDCVNAQAGRYSRVCRVFAPLYRQITLTALNGNATPSAADRAQGYDDVIAAFNHYLTQYNQGRGFVLIGHSQGSGVLQRVMAAEIDSRPELRARLISAHLLGTSVAVPEGADVGGVYKNIPVCRKDDQTGCVLAYATFRDRSPPPSDSRFGKVASGRAVCANPAALSGGKAGLIPYLKPGQVRGGMRVMTPFVSPRDFLQGECIDKDQYTYLELSILNAGMGSLPSDVSADIGANWGLHLIDVHIAMGNLVDLAAKQAAALPKRP